MNGLPQLVVSGLATGGIYAMLALGLVLIYQVSGVVNFAQGALATAGAYVTWSFATTMGLTLWLAMGLALAVALCFGMLLHAVLMRPLQRAPAVSSLIVTLGLLAVIEGAIGQAWGYDIKVLGGAVSAGPILLGDAFVNRLDLATIGASVVLIAAFFAFLRWTRVGAALRAVAQSPQGARLVGIRVERVLLIGWGVGTALAAAAGVLIAEHTLMSPTMADIYLLSAFSGAVIGGLDSLPGAAAGALLIGMIQNLVAAYISIQWRDGIVFVLLLAMLLARPTGLFGSVAQPRV